MELGEKGADGRCNVKPVDGSEFRLDADCIVPAIGQQVDHSFVTPEDGVRFTRGGLRRSQRADTLMSSRKGIFAGGDCVTGPATLVQAMAQGHQAARCIGRLPVLSAGFGFPPRIA